MKNQLSRLTTYFITVYLFISAFNSTFASPFHHERPANNRRYARTLTNLNVGEPRTVRLIYFLPTDWSYHADEVQRIKDTIRTVQTFYAEQMDAHGYGKTTFRVESDPQGNPIVHRMDGQHLASFYSSSSAHRAFSKVAQAFDTTANIYVIVLGTDQYAGGFGGNQGKNGGEALVYAGRGYRRLRWGTVAHELGHALGLPHDFRDGEYIMSYGPGLNRLSRCAADFLAVHPYFNPDASIEAGNHPTIELVSPRRYPPGSMSAPIRFKLSDAEGLSQVSLLVTTLSSGDAAAGALELKACRQMGGEKDIIVEFDYDGVIPSDGLTNLSNLARHPITISTVDTDGNVGYTDFTLVEISPHHITSLDEHTAYVESVSFSPDGRTLASGSSDTTVKLWDVEARQNIDTIEGHVNTIESVGFSPSGTLATVAADGEIMLWDVATRQRIAAFGYGYLAGRTNCMSFSPDGKIIARGDNAGVALWDVATRAYIATLPHGDIVLSVSFSRDGILASGSEDGTVKLWDVATRTRIATLPHENTVLSVMFSPDGETLATAGWGGIEVWDVATRSRLTTLPHGATVSSVSFSTDGKTLVSGGWDGMIKLWDMTARAIITTFWSSSGIRSVALSPDGKALASGSSEGVVELWDISRLAELRDARLTPVEFADINLANQVRSALGLPAGAAILKAQLEGLTFLDASQWDAVGRSGRKNQRSYRLRTRKPATNFMAWRQPNQ